MATTKAPPPSKIPSAQQNGAATDDEDVKEAEAALEILEPMLDGKSWVIGKPPEHGGKETEYSVYTQLPLGYMA